MMNPLYKAKADEYEVFSKITINGISYVHSEDLDALFKYAINFYEKLFKKGTLAINGLNN
jgi:hypothetical protein